MKSKSNKKFFYLTVLNVISAFAVVCMHVNSCFWTYSTEPYWFSANIIECFFYFAVPVFFMISGTTLIDYKERYSTKEFFKRRIVKTFIPFLAWSMVALIWNILTSKVQITQLNVSNIFNGIFGTSWMGIYWFFPSLFCLYLCIPLLASIGGGRVERRTIFIYIAVAGFTLNALCPFVISVFKLKFVWPFDVDFGCKYVLYAVIGYLLSTQKISKKTKNLIYIGAIFGLLLHIVGTYYLSKEAGEVIDLYKGYLNVPCIMYSVGIFVLFRECASRLEFQKGIVKIVDMLGDCMFGVYLCHMYILYIVKLICIHMFSVNETSLVYRLIVPFVVFGVAVLVVKIMKRIPMIKKIVPS